jgi:MFS family permease
MIRRATTVLALLTGLNLLNYIDRYVLSAVLPKIQDDLHLTGFIAGSLGTVFLLGYFITSPFFGSLADRGGRRTWLIAIGIVVWSLATAASGLAASAGSLVVARAFVGVGEAAYATIAPTIIDDIAPAEKRGKWLAIFYSAIPIGSALGFIVGGKIEHAYGWRAAFFAAGGPGVVLALSCLFIFEPPRVVPKVKVSVVQAFKTLAPILQYRRAVLGYCAGTFAVGGFAFWAPTFLYRRYDMALDKANFMFGALTVVGGALGTALGGWLGDRWARAAAVKSGAKTPEEIDHAFVIANLRVCALSSLLATPAAVACFLSPTPTIFFISTFVCELGLFISMSPINAVILRSVPAALRAGAMALSIFAIHLLGDLWSPPLTGLLADHAPIQWAMMILPVAIAASGVIWFVPDVTRKVAGADRLG